MKVVSERGKHAELKNGGNYNKFPKIQSGTNRDHKQAASIRRGGPREPRRNPCRRGSHFDSELNHAGAVRDVAAYIGQMLKAAKKGFARMRDPGNGKRSDDAHGRKRK